MSIHELLIPALQTEFSECGLRVGLPPDPIASFPSKCEGIGELSICDDGEEATVYISNVTHHHVNPYDMSLSREAREELIANDVLEFLRDLFGDRVLLWSVEGGKRGGWQRPFEGGIPTDVPMNAKVFVWSRQLR